MDLRSLRKTALLGGILCLSMSMFAQSALAAKWADTPSGLDMIIVNVYADLGSGLLILSGQNFDSGDYPVVTLGDLGLEVFSYTPEELIAGLPPDIMAGDYRLTVSTGNAVRQFDSYDLTIGAVGPEGPQGLRGSDGPPGQDGADGTSCTVTGNTGSATVSCTDGTTATLVDGADGATGPPGPPGQQGEPGVCSCPVSLEDFEALVERVGQLEGACIPELEICDGLDNNCNGLTDEENPVIMCPPGDEVVTTEGSFGNCVVATCSQSWGDLDEDFSNGCECAPDWRDDPPNDQCTDSFSLGTLRDDTGDWVTVIGRLSTPNDVDFYSFYAQDLNLWDATETFDQFNPSFEFTSNPGSEFAMKIYSGSPSCDRYIGINTGTSNVTLYGTPPQYRCNWSEGDLCSSQAECAGGQCLLFSNDDSDYYYVEVYRGTGRTPTCSEYELSIRLGR
jgi:hypothetical protein